MSLDIFDYLNSDHTVDASNLPTIPEPPNTEGQDPREAFETLLSALQGENRVDLNAMDDAFTACRSEAFKKAWTQKFGKRKFNPNKANEAFPELSNHFFNEAERIAKEYHNLREKLRDQLDTLAEQIEPQPGDTWTKAYSCNSTSYATQGLGAHSYARASAKSRIPHYERNGLEAELRVEHRDNGISDYEVWVKADKLDVEIASRREGMSLVDYVQWCWDNGSNPRVFMPYLPHGFEEQHGISFLSRRSG